VFLIWIYQLQKDFCFSQGLDSFTTFHQEMEDFSKKEFRGIFLERGGSSDFLVEVTDLGPLNWFLLIRVLSSPMDFKL